MKFFLVCSLLLVSFITDIHASALDKKGKVYFYYGWNRSTYTTSDLHLTGDGYDFTLRNVKARDRQSEVGLDPYLHPTNWSIPQTNIRLGYYLTDTLSLSLGNDHMKYVMDRNQTVRFEGNISNTGNPDLDNLNDGDDVPITDDFLLLEHTDGLNYFSFELEKYFPVWKNSTEAHALSLYIGPGLAIMYPKTNATLFGKQRYDEFNFAGYGFSLKAGLEFIIYERFFARLVAKYGEIRMDNVKTTSNSNDNLSQKFFFSEGFIVFGGNF